MQQEDAASAQQKQALNIEAVQKAATVQVAAGSAGVSGLAVDGVLRDLYAQKGRNDVILDNNASMTANALQYEKKNAETGGQSQINAVPVGEAPSILPTLVNVFGSGLNAYSDFKKRQ